MVLSFPVPISGATSSLSRGQRFPSSGLGVNIKAFLTYIHISPFSGINIFSFQSRRTFSSRGRRTVPSVSQLLLPVTKDFILTFSQSLSGSFYSLGLFLGKAFLNQLKGFKTTRPSALNSSPGGFSRLFGGVIHTTRGIFLHN